MVNVENGAGLCHFAALEIAPHLVQNQQTLKHLSINTYVYFSNKGNWSSVFRSLHLTQLRTLECYGIQFNIDSLAIMLNQCPVLDTLILRRIPLRFDQSFVKQIHIMPFLRNLDFDGGTFDNDFPMATVLGRFPALETLVLCNTSATLDLLSMMEYLKQLKRLELVDIYKLTYDQPMDELAAVARQSKIETVILDKVPNVSDKLLQVFARAPALRYLRANLEPDLCAEDGLAKFATLLRNTVIDVLNIYNVRSMSYAMLDGLGNLPHLTTLAVTNPCFRNSPTIRRMTFRHPPTLIDKNALVQMLRNSKSLSYLYAPRIAIISSDGM